MAKGIDPVRSETSSGIDMGIEGSMGSAEEITLTKGDLKRSLKHPAYLADGTPIPRLIAWEITRSCNLACVHCRASSIYGPYPNELTTKECFGVIDDIVGGLGKPTLIMTGGEPLMRSDIFEITEYAIEKGLRVAFSPNGTLLTEEVAKKLASLGVRRISISLDFPKAGLHDKFRGVKGAFAGALRGIENAKKAGLEFQVNTTVTKLNVSYLDEMVDLALKLGAVAFFPFLLVPTGRGKELEKEELPPAKYEEVLNWAFDKSKETGLFFKLTDCPHYYRVVRQRAKKGETIIYQSHGYETVTRGCAGGISFGFLSHIGDVQMCGYLEVPAGNVRKKPFSEIWKNSPFFKEIRDFSLLKGKCGFCEYKKVCGGCRARAYALTGDYLQEEKYCVYIPKTLQKKENSKLKAPSEKPQLKTKS